MSAPAHLVELFERRVHAHHDANALLSRHLRCWSATSWQQWWTSSEQLGAALLAAGHAPGDHLAILSNTRVEWALADLAAMMIRAPIVPLYPTHTAEQLCWCLAHAEVATLIIEDPALLARLLDAALPACLKRILVIEPEVAHRASDASTTRTLRLSQLALPEHLHTSLFRDALLEGRAALVTDAALVARERAQIDPDALVTLVYTSGTQGRGRGVMLTQRQLAAEVEAMMSLGVLRRGDVQLLVLPLAHIFGRMLLWAGVGYGMQTALSDKPARLREDLSELRPHMMGGVPQLFETMQRHIERELQGQPEPLATLLQAALDAGHRVSQHIERDEPLNIRDRIAASLLSKTLRRDVRALFGGRVSFLISGGAPLPAAVASFFHACGVLILEGWGMTETCGATTFNLPDSFRFGTIGHALPKLDVTLASDGEILVRGPTVMTGYWREPEQTKQAIDEAGWLHTGDLGSFDARGFLSIVGRKKELIVTAGGKKVAPLHIEAALQARWPISQAILIGDARRYIIALIFPDPTALVAWANERGIPTTSWPLLVQHPRVEELIREHVDAVNAHLASFETIRKFALLSTPLTIEAQELTPTLKPRRDQIARTRALHIESLYRASVRP